MSISDHPIEPPTPSSLADAAEARWMLRTGFALGLLSAVALILLVLGLDAIAGLTVVPAAIGVVALILVGLTIAAAIALLAAAMAVPDDRAIDDRPTN